MRLWKHTFHDSDSYIELVFSNYFNPELVEYEETDGQLVSAMLGVEYSFEESGTRLKALYLCGLSTRENARGNGIMTELLERMNKKAAAAGYDFTFLIPADSGLRQFYVDSGYVEGIYRVRNLYTNLHDFVRDYKSILSKVDSRISVLKFNYFNSLKCREADTENPDDIEAITKFIQVCESHDYGMTLRHSSQDIAAIVKESKISGNEIVIVENKKNDIRSIGFFSKDGHDRIKVNRIFQQDACGFYKTLEWIKNKYPEYGLCVYQDPETDKEVALWTFNYMPQSSVAGVPSNVAGVETAFRKWVNVELYGMVKILNMESIMRFMAETKKADFSIFMKDSSRKEVYGFTGKDGRFTFDKYDENIFVERFGAQKLGVAMSKRGLSAIVCRKPDSDNWINAAFGIPRLALNASLLLD